MTEQKGEVILMNAKQIKMADKELREEVETYLDRNPDVPLAKVGVSVSNGVITLSGYVNTLVEKLAAEKTAKLVYGVRAVANEIEVKPTSEYVDPDIAAAAVEAIRRNPSLPLERIKIIVRKGWVTLEGKVGWDFQKQDAENAVRSLSDVRGVSNNIEVEPH